ncbi:MAG: hypothetical protein J6L77_08140 [Coprococcus sp.]|nr:hypothetical protein [Coprococcus sp.]
MINYIKYELYRIRKNKGFYIIIVVLFAFSAAMPILYKSCRSAIIEIGKVSYEEEGMDNSLIPMFHGKWYLEDFSPDMTDFVAESITHRLPLIAFLIFMILLIGSEFTSGYIKSVITNIKKWQIATAHFIIGAFVAFLFMLVQIVSGIVSYKIMYPDGAVRNITHFFELIGLELLLYVAYITLLQVFIYLMLSPFVSTILAVFEGVSGSATIVMFANIMIQEYFGAKYFTLDKYTPVSNILLAGSHIGTSQMTVAAVSGLVVLIVCYILNIVILSKREIK